MKVRIKFSKHGPIRYIGHLDMMRYFQKAIRRSGIPVQYTQGFNPHQRLAFAQPLGVGVESDGEYFDVELTSLLPRQTMIDQLNETMADGVKILDIVLLPEGAKNAMASVQAASYFVTYYENYAPTFDWQNQLFLFLQQEEILYCKETKKNSMELNLKPAIYDYRIMDDGFYFQVNASSAGNIKPRYIFEAFFDSLKMELPEYALHINRLETFGFDSTTNKYVPMSAFGEDF